MNIIEHGFTKAGFKALEVDVRCIYENNSISITVRDNCPGFDPEAWLALHSGEDTLKGIGIKLIKDIASEMNYRNTIGMNILTISIPA